MTKSMLIYNANLKLNKQKMSTIQYYRLALLQYIHYQQSLEEYIKREQEIIQLRQKVAAHQKKHRRCDRQIQKQQQCQFCQKKYASDVALKLHLKLKHAGDANGNIRSSEDGSGGEVECRAQSKENRVIN